MVDHQGEPKALGAELTEFDREPGVVTIFEFANITVVIWEGQATARAVELLHRATERRRRQYSRGLSVIHIVRGHIALPDSGTREAFVRLMKSSNRALACVGIVVGGSGFWASTARSLITGMRVLAGGSFDMRLHGSIDDLCAWLPAKHETKTGFAISAAQLEAALCRAQQLAGDVVVTGV